MSPCLSQQVRSGHSFFLFGVEGREEDPGGLYISAGKESVINASAM